MKTTLALWESPNSSIQGFLWLQWFDHRDRLAGLGRDHVLASFYRFDRLGKTLVGLS